MTIIQRPKTLLVWLAVLLALTGCKKIDSTVTVSYEGTGRITESDKIDCGTQCSAEYSISQLTGSPFTTPAYDITLTAAPATGFELFTWTTDCGKSLTCKQRIETQCSVMPPFGTLCTVLGGVNINLHAVFVPAGSVAQEYRYGTDHSCLVDTSGILKCWGPEGFGGSSVPAVPNPVEVKLAWHSACARSGSENRLYCWGNDAISQMPDLANPGDFVVQDNQNCSIIDGQVSCAPTTYGYFGPYACALDQNQLKCWGNVPPGISSKVPTLNQPVALWGSGQNLCVQDASGDHCWGNDLIGQSRVPALNQPSAIAASGGNGTCALTTDGLRCWGYSADGSALDGTLINPGELNIAGNICIGDDTGMRCFKPDFTPIALPPELQDSHLIRSQNQFACGQDDTGIDCYDWMDNPASLPFRPAGVGVADAFDVWGGWGYGHGACAISGRILNCWGDLSFWPAQTSANRTLSLRYPRVISIEEDAWCVGGTDGLQCRYKYSDSTLASTQPNNLRGIRDLELSLVNGCALHNAGVTCWGDNRFGVNDVPALQNPLQIALGFAHACALDDTGVVCWGEKLQRPE